MTLLVHLALLLVQLIFGANHVVAKLVMRHVSPLALAGVRVVAATPLLLAAAWALDRRLPARRDLPLLAVLGLTGVSANQLLFLFGLQHSTATNAAILMLSIPAFTVAIAAALRVERASGTRLLGVGLALAGALVMVHPQQLTLAGGALRGDLLLLANCLCYSCYLVLQRPLAARLGWGTLVAWAFVFGAALTIPVAWPALVGLQLAALSSAVLWGIAFVVICATALGYLLNAWGVVRSSPIVVAAYITVQPLVGATLAALLLGERMSWHDAFAAALIVSGLLLVSVRGRSPQ